MAKKMYVIQAEDGMFFCGVRYWDKQLRKAKIYHSLSFARDVVDAYEESNCKIVEVSLTIVPEEMTNADRFRAMSYEEQQKCVRRFWEIEDFADWLKQPAEGR